MFAVTCSGKKSLTSRTYSLIWCVTYYLTLAVVGFCQPFMFEPETIAIRLSGLAMALPPAYWLVRDAKLRGVYVPHVIQPFVAGLWYLVVPIYLLATRKWWGLLFLILHFFFSSLVLFISYEISVNFVWPAVFP